MQETNRLKLTKGQLFWHYSVIPFLLITPVMSLYSVFEIEISHTYTGVRTTEEILTFGLPWLVPTLIFGLIQYRRLNFKKIKTKLTSKDFKSITQKAGDEMNWSFISLNSNYALAFTRFNWASWGERITIIRCENEILINSICDPDNRPSVTSWGQNRKNLNALRKRLITRA